MPPANAGNHSVVPILQVCMTEPVALLRGMRTFLFYGEYFSEEIHISNIIFPEKNT
jgi:hypothetical protein